MSVQTGVWNLTGPELSRELLVKVSQLIAQYGPDGEGMHSSGPVHMLYRPFHTTSEARLERQPFVSFRGNAITWDGRLDNREDLMSQLRDELAFERTDVAIAMAAFERWGADCFSRLIGDWALSIWVSRENSLIFARDVAGVRHLYYWTTSERVVWCSHLAPLVLLGGQFTVNDKYIAGYLASNPEAHLTPYREIRAVPPGHFVQVSPRTVMTRSFWSLKPFLRIQYKRDEDYEEHFRHVFRQAVRRRLRADSPVLAELSGGLDSSSIVCMADDILAREGAPAPRLDTVSYYNVSEPQGDERFYFSKVEEKRGRQGCHIDSGKGLTFFAPGQTFLATPGSLGNASQVESKLHDLIQRQGNRVLLSGIGGDELLGGVPNPSSQLADYILQLRLLKLSSELMAWSAVKRQPWIHLLFDALREFLPTAVLARVTRAAKIENWIDPAFASRTGMRTRQLGPDDTFGLWLPSRRARVQTFLALVRLIAFIRPALAGCVERRYPYLDQTLAEFLISIPASQLLRPGQRRSLMRRALVGILPPEVLERHTKGVTARRYMASFADSWPELEDLFRSPISSSLGFINSSRFQACVFAAKHGTPTHLLRMLRAVSLELWIRDLATRNLIALPTLPTTSFEPKSMSPVVSNSLTSTRAR